MKKINLTGQIFNSLTVLRESHKSNSGRIMWLCRCACGTEKPVDGYVLKSGHTKSCGCHKNKFTAESNTTHGMSKTLVYAVWICMKDRCLNKENKDYPHYGGRGITVCDRWFNSFQSFIDDMRERPQGYSIERKDNNKGYSPDNCHWAKPVDQGRNKRNTIFLSIGASTKPLAELAEAVGLKYDRVYQRKLRGATDKESLSPNHGKRKYLTLGTITKSLAEWSHATGIKKTTIQMRLRSGWPVDRALTQGASL